MIPTTSLTGPFPRSEALVRATRDLDRGRTSAEAVEELYRAAEREVVRIEERLGLDPLTGGYLRWPDLFRPFAEQWSGFSVGPVTRWFETNTFFRQPILHGLPERTAGALVNWLPAAQAGMEAPRAKVVLPGPYTFAGLLDNRSGEPVESLTQRLGRLLGEEVAELRRRGYATFQFQEPLLTVRPPSGATQESVVQAYRSIASGVPGSHVIVWTYFGDATPVFSLLGRLPVETVGIDLSETDPRSLPENGGRRAIGLGVVDPRTTLVEDPGEVARVVRAIAERLHPTGLLLGPGAPLDLLPWEAALRKLHTLPAARQLIANGGGAA